MTRYRIDSFGFIYRKKQDGLPETYNAVKDEWERGDEDAFDAFYEGSGSHEVTEEQAMAEIAKYKKSAK